MRNGLAIASQQRKHLDVEAAVPVNTLAIERARAEEGPKAAKTTQKYWLIESTGRDNVRAYQAMSAEMTVMNDTYYESIAFDLCVFFCFVFSLFCGEGIFCFLN